MISLDKVILAAASLQTTARSFSAGDIVFQRGARAQFVYVVSKGALCRLRPLPGGRRAVLQFLFRGDGFGYEPDSYHRDTVQALTDVEVLAAERKGLMAASKAGASEALFAAATQALVVAEEQSALVRGRTATERTALFLLEMHARLSKGDQIVLPMTRKDISDYLGLTIETVSRTMNAFRRAKIIEISQHFSRQIVILNKARLEELGSDNSKFEWWKR